MRDRGDSTARTSVARAPAGSEGTGAGKEVCDTYDCGVWHMAFQTQGERDPSPALRRDAQQHNVAWHSFSDAKWQQSRIKKVGPTRARMQCNTTTPPSPCHAPGPPWAPARAQAAGHLRNGVHGRVVWLAYALLAWLPLRW